MPAFTHLCEKINLSLFDNTLTIYPKKTGQKRWGVIMNACKQTYLGMIDEEYSIKDELYSSVYAWGHPRYVHRNDFDHHLFHADSFNLDDTHIHMQFSFKLDELALNKILSLFVKHNVLAWHEKDSFLVAFTHANRLCTNKTHKQEDYSLVDSKFFKELIALKVKVLQLKNVAVENPAYNLAADEAQKLYDKLKEEMDVYNKDRTKETYEVFKKNCNKAISDARPVLETHRGYKNILCNLAAAIIGLGVFYFLATTINYYCSNGKHFFFQFDTDSIKKINKIEAEIESAAPAA